MSKTWGIVIFKKPWLMLRRSKIATENKIQFGNTNLIYNSLTVVYNDKEVLMSQKEFYISCYLILIKHLQVNI